MKSDWFIIGLLIIGLSSVTTLLFRATYDAGQSMIVESCAKVGAFYYKDKVFDCKERK